jgi:hypothetical protein
MLNIKTAIYTCFIIRQQYNQLILVDNRTNKIVYLTNIVPQGWILTPLKYKYLLTLSCIKMLEFIITHNNNLEIFCEDNQINTSVILFIELDMKSFKCENPCYYYILYSDCEWVLSKDRLDTSKLPKIFEKDIIIPYNFEISKYLETKLEIYKTLIERDKKTLNLRKFQNENQIEGSSYLTKFYFGYPELYIESIIEHRSVCWDYTSGDEPYSVQIKP